MELLQNYESSHEGEDSDEETEEKQTGVGELDIKEWTMTLRENVICLDEQNVKVKRLKIEAIE